MALRVQSLTSDKDKVQLGKLNVLVGPNNCGKSQTLRDIRDYIATGSTQRLTILREVEIELPPKDEAIKALTISPHDTPNHVMVRGVIHDLERKHEFALQENWIDERFKNIGNPADVLQLLGHLGKYWVAHLDAESRLRLANPTECYDTRTETPSNAMQAFFAGGDEPLTELRGAFKDAFGMDIALDWAAMKRWYLMIGPAFGAIPNDRNTLTGLLKDARPLASQGDGYRSFAGVVLAMLTFADRLLLFDEPDAFLHPAQARVLGRWLGMHTKMIPAQVLLATHNSDFLWGIISAEPDATVIRLNRVENTTRYHVVPAETTKNLVQSPLLSSQPVLDSLFQKGVAVCEGDPDRAVYQTVAHKYTKGLGGEDILFIHANGKDAVKNPLEMLRTAGTPVCAIVDFDVLNSEQVLREILTSLSPGRNNDEVLALRHDIAKVVENAPEDKLVAKLRESVESWNNESITDLREARRRLAGIAQKASKWSEAKARGVDLFQGKERGGVERLITLCGEAGLFIVTKGELESWMDLGTSKGKEWNRKALQDLHDGKCPPDLRQFVEGVAKFLVPLA